MNRMFSIFILVPISLNIMSCTKGADSSLLTTDSFSRGLLAYYPFNGNANDASGNGNGGLIRGATLTSDRFGSSDCALHFNGGSFILIPELFPDTCMAFSFAVWVMKDTTDGNTHTIIYKGLDQGEAVIGLTSLPDGPVLGFGVNIETGTRGAQNWYYYNIPDTLRAKTHYFLVGRYIRGERVDLLVNGKLMGSSTVPNAPLASWPGHSYSAIGEHWQFPSSSGWNGVIDDIRIYDRPLSDAEVQALYYERGWTGN
jgi:hypothetical protein